ncbi:GspE/PulE family protein [Acidovorax sp. sic0104]|uniref:GspE/PulE family protein n=1 Tax=Acidovorax sp. sic0104 TaxID=2854784 RepID=UPI001C44E3B8|nr:ATPase, T2SS/T4P/T4SS family [Acidovorax sp. sic0104]MBV7542124.1 Flp pilus assembly complex ATPase component TadA [Acidovorax sp. sic0104]
MSYNATHGMPQRTGRVHHEIEAEPTEFISSSSTDLQAVKFLNDLFRDSARMRVSDIHFEDQEGRMIVRRRLAGDLHQHSEHTKQMSREVNRLIRMKGKRPLMDSLEPVDTSIRFDVDGRMVDVRISIVPSDHGASIVCRLLDQAKNLMTLDQISMPELVREGIRHIIRQPEGLFLVTGPTGSGKTTTLYGILQELNQPEVKIVTIEDPIEYRVQGLMQCATTVRMDFGQALKAFLRQDPEIILVGEVRDSETARTAAQAALTGHIVLSTLHTNSAAVSMSRMLDLNVAPNVLSACMGGFLAQRLVQKVCPNCRVPHEVGDYERKQMRNAGMDEDAIQGCRVVYSINRQGCDHKGCAEGMVGLTPVFELILATKETRLACEERDLKALMRAAKLQPQYRTLGHAAMELAVAGITTLQQAISLTAASQD